MKKIKLLTGLSTLSIFAISTLPLTSCNKFDGKVTEAEWKAAIETIVNPESEWYFGQEGDHYAGGSYVSESSYAINSYSTWVRNKQGTDAVGLAYSPNREAFPVEALEKNIDGDFGYHKMIEKRKTGDRVLYSIGPAQSWISWAIFFYTIYDNQSSFTLDNDGYYTFEGVLEEKITTNSKIKFGSDKKIQHLKATASVDYSEYTQLYDFDIHFNYSRKEIKFDDDFLNRIDKHCYKMNNTESIDFDPTICAEQHEGLFFSIIPPTGKTYTKISCYSQESIVKMFGGMNLNKNGIPLNRDTEYTINQDGSITIIDGFTANDQICFSIRPNLIDKQYKLQIA